MSAGGYRRRRAPKPLRVPLLAALAGALVFLLGMALASATIAGLGLMFVAWGVLSFLFLLLSRRVRAARRHRDAAGRP